MKFGNIFAYIIRNIANFIFFAHADLALCIINGRLKRQPDDVFLLRTGAGRTVHNPQTHVPFPRKTTCKGGLALAPASPTRTVRARCRPLRRPRGAEPAREAGCPLPPLSATGYVCQPILN